MPIASLLAIGNELLNGTVRDANVFSLSQHLTRMGFSVEYAAMVRDIPQKIADVVLFLLAQQPDVLLCSGGLGPTQDDLTLSALAEALHMPLALNSAATDLVEYHYDRLLAQQYLTQRGPAFAREKMATLPLGAQPLPNPVGTAPGVKMEHQGTVIYVLPGVPAELKAIFAASIVPELLRRFTPGIWAEYTMLVYCDDEADLAIPLCDVAQRHPEVYLKSLAQPFPVASAEGLKVIAVALAATASEAHAAARATLADLRCTAEAVGLRVGELSTSTDWPEPNRL
ncbi:MAG: competence/damage-inducible protein A [Anaerolineae bacterium]|nr:competence/damage-inducible protein A [Anaerolineae bacterium]